MTHPLMDFSDFAIATMLRECYNEAKALSDDPQTQNAAMIVSPDGNFIRAVAANTIPTLLVMSPDRIEAPLKYDFIEHAERAVIYSSESVTNSAMVCVYAACPACARAIILSEITCLISHEDAILRGSWKDRAILGLDMLREAKIDVRLFKGKVERCTNLLDGKEWNP